MRYLPPLPEKYKGAVLGGILLLGLIVTSALVGSRGMVHLARIRSQQAETEEAASTLAAENQHLRDHLSRLEHDDAYLEKLGRERLGWIKPGEIVYHVPSTRPALRPEADAADPAPTPERLETDGSAVSSR